MSRVVQQERKNSTVTHQAITHFMDTNVIQSQNYLFVVYKQYKERTCPCIEWEVVLIPKMKPAKDVSRFKNIYNLFTQLKLAPKATSSRNSGSPSYICLSSSNYTNNKIIQSEDKFYPMKGEKIMHQIKLLTLWINSLVICLKSHPTRHVQEETI